MADLEKGGAKPGEGEGDEQELTKEEQATLKGKVADAEKRASDAQRSLTDPDYLEYLAEKRRKEEAGDDDKGKRDGKAKPAAVDLSKVDWETLSNKDLASLIVRVLREDFKGIATDVGTEFERVGDEID